VFFFFFLMYTFFLFFLVGIYPYVFIYDKMMIKNKKIWEQKGK